MKLKEARIVRLLEENGRAMSAKEFSKLADMNKASVSKIMASLAKKGMIGRNHLDGQWMYYPLEVMKDTRGNIAEDTRKKHDEYVRMKVVGNRAYTYTHMDMLKILASQGNMKAKKEIERRTGEAYR